MGIGILYFGTTVKGKGNFSQARLIQQTYIIGTRWRFAQSVSAKQDNNIDSLLLVYKVVKHQAYLCI